MGAFSEFMKKNFVIMSSKQLLGSFEISVWAVKHFSGGIQVCRVRNTTLFLRGIFKRDLRIFPYR